MSQTKPTTITTTATATATATATNYNNNNNNNNNNLNNNSNSNSNPAHQTEIQSDQIKKALSGLSPSTRHSLLMVLLTTQQQHQQQHQQQQHQQQELHQHQTRQQQQQQQQQHHQQHQLQQQHHHHQELQQQHHLSQKQYHHLQQQATDQQQIYSLDLQSPKTVDYPFLNNWNNLDLLSSLQPNSNNLNHEIHSQLKNALLSAQMSTNTFQTDSIPHEIPPLLSPNMTPLSTFSTGSYRNPSSISDTLSSHNSGHQAFQPSNHQLEFFSPLTSPALRPLSYHNNPTPINPNEIHNPLSPNHQTSLPHAIPALVDQAATLGLSTPHSFVPHDLISSTTTGAQNDPVQSYLNTSTSSLFPSSTSNLMTDLNTSTNQVPINDLVINHSASINQSPLLLPHPSSNKFSLPSGQTSPHQAPQSGRSRPVRGSKNRPSPMIRAVDEALESTEERTGPAKRARSQTGMSVPTSPEFSSVLAKIGLADSPSPIDLHPRELTLLGPSSALGDTINPHARRPQSSPSVPLPHGPQPVPANPAAWHIQPMTPASLFNFQKPPSGPAGDSHENHSLPDGRICGKLDSVMETDESANLLKSPSGAVDVVPEAPADLKDQTDQVNQKAKSKRKSTGPKEKNPTNGSQQKSRKAKEVPRSEASQAGSSQAKEAVESGMGSTHEEEGPEYRKSSHKVAEQRRRDSLKMCFEDLRQLLPAMSWGERDDGPRDKRPGEGNVGGQRSVHAFDPLNPNKGMSKVALLRRSNEYIVRLKERLERRDGAIKMMVEILEQHELLGDLLGRPPSTSSPKPAPVSGDTPTHSDDALDPGQPGRTDAGRNNQHTLDSLKAILCQIGRETQEDKDDHCADRVDKDASRSSLSEEIG